MLLVRIDQILGDILVHLFTAEYRRLAGWIDRIVVANQEAYGDSSLNGFVHEGVVYKPMSHIKVPNTSIKRRGLHPTLLNEMDAYIRDLKVLNDDKAFIRQGLLKALDGCQSAQEIRDALPNCLAEGLELTRGLSRMNDEAFTIKDDPRALRQYLQVLPKIEMYAATRLIY